MLTTERRRPARGIFKRHDRAADLGWRFRLHEIIFEADTRGGKLFDVALMLAIVASVAVVMIESLPDMGPEPPGSFASSGFSRSCSPSSMPRASRR